MIDRRSCVHILVISVLCLCAALAQAAEGLPGAEQLKQQFQQLSPEQRQAAARALGGQPAPATMVEMPAPLPPEGVAPAPDGRAETGALRLRAGDTLVLGLQTPPASPDRLPATEKRLYRLDQAGAIVLPDAGRIVLAGLSEREAVERLSVEPALAGRVVSLQLLPVEPELRQFGLDLFRGVPSTFAPAGNIPVPADYVIGPGDSVIVQLFGKDNSQHELTVTRDGALLFPGIGPLSVAGLTFSRMQDEVQGRVRRQLSGVTASVTLGRIRSIRIFVLGDAETPGSYLVSGMSTLTNALFVSGGVKPIGSLRDIQLKRNGRLVSRLDLYDLLLRGDTSGDARLLPGDVIFVAPAGRQAGIAGQVRRPALYELKDETTVGDLIDLAGGLLPEAYPRQARIERIGADHRRVLLDIDLMQPAGRQTALQDGDVVRIVSVLDRVAHAVTLSGHVNRPGDYQWFAGMRLTDLLPSMAELQPRADAHYQLIVRRDPASRDIRFIDADLAAALEGKDPADDPELQSEDEIRVFALDEDRSAAIRPLLALTETQSSPGRPLHIVTIDGTVHHPGQYPLSPGMKVSDLLRAAGGLTDRAYTLTLELTRHSVVEGERREMSRHDIDLAAVLDGAVLEDMTLAAYDQVVVRRIPSWDEAGNIELKGEVRFPGNYPVARGDRLSEVIRRAGGLTPEAYPRAAVFLRESVRLREQESIDQLALRLEHELAKVVPEDDEKSSVEGELLLRQIHAAQATGRMVIDLEQLLRDEGYDISVNAGDRLYIPQKPEEVTVIGEVYNPTSHLYNPKLDRDDYIRLSGNVTESGNKKAIYVVHADGSVSPDGGWFDGRIVMGPGDTVVVPMKLERLSRLKLITSVSQILYQLALTAASLDVVGVF
ncbi:MAG: SLBB domain-containing protein [Gammaproteobacteria bacterium]